MRKSSISIIVIYSLTIILLTSCECDRKIDFQDSTVSTRYNLGSTFISNGQQFKVTQFFWANGNPSPDGFIEVEDQSTGNIGSGGSRNNLEINNSNLELQINQTIQSIKIDVGHWGGNMNLKINGDLKNFDSVGSINGSIIGGVNVSTNGSKDNPGLWKFIGSINEFEIGGQEFYVDNICIKK